MTDRGPAPTSGGPAEVLLHERASATPTRARTAAQHAHPAGVIAPAAGFAARGTREAPVTVSLRAAQEWLADVICHPSSAADGMATSPVAMALGLRGEADAERVITSGPRLTALERVAIYHHAYRARLIECLADDYPALANALGEDAFDALASAYVIAHPSHSPSLNAYGRHMATFCREPAAARALAALPDAVFAADLAALEWAMVEVLHAAEAPAIGTETLAAVPAERWGDARLPANPTLRLLHFAYPVNAYFQSFRNDDRPEIPGPAAAATAVYRQGILIWRMDLTPAMAGLLERLFAGATLGAALEAIEVAAESAEALAEAERNVMVWFREWVASGFFARVVLDDLDLS